MDDVDDVDERYLFLHHELKAAIGRLFAAQGEVPLAALRELVVKAECVFEAVEESFERVKKEYNALEIGEYVPGSPESAMLRRELIAITARMDQKTARIDDRRRQQRKLLEAMKASVGL